MTKAQEELVQRHTPHGWTVAPANATIRNVERSATQKIMTCPCGWYGWIDNEAFEEA